MQPTKRHRFVALDGLRGIAALSIVFYHLQVSNHVTHIQLVRNGYLAVDLFFILSGFVIYSSYASRINSTADFARFIGLRFFRVYPMHIATLLFLFGFEILKLWSLRSGFIGPGDRPPFTGPTSLGAFVGNVALVQGLGIFDRLTWNVPSWSISSEFAAYLLFGVIALFGWFRTKTIFPIFLILGCTGYCFVAVVHGDLNATYDYGIVRCLAGFFIGVTIFELTRQARDDFRSSIGRINVAQLATTAAFFLVMALFSGAGIVTIIPVFIGSVVLLQFDTGIVAKLLMTPVAQFLGRISYSIYMVHQVVLNVEAAVLKRVFQIPSIVDPTTQVPVFQTSQGLGDLLLVGSLLIIVVISDLTYKVIENPARKWGRKFLSETKG